VTSCPITSISHSAGGATLHAADGRELRAKKLVLTMSLKVLQSGKVKFTPQLPEEKRAAIGRLRMGNAVKVGVGSFRRSAYGACGLLPMEGLIWQPSVAY
jgi:monoamine oxidase